MIDCDDTTKITHLKHAVQQMLYERTLGVSQDKAISPSPIWTETLGPLAYVMNLSEEDFLNIRFHTGLITGESIYQYWHNYPPLETENFAERIGYKFYTEDIPKDYWIGEPSTPKIPRPIGVAYRGLTINYNICRYQACISALYSMGILKFLSEQKGKNLILEIGGGYGGIAHALGNLLKQTTYIILDLPEMLLFSGGYLICNNPQKNIYIYEKETFTPDFLRKDIYLYDYLLIPNYVLKDLYNVSELNLMINTQSFQEMTREQVTEYLEFGSTMLSGYIYSDNMDIHPFNNAMSPATVTKLLDDYFHLFPSHEFYEKINKNKEPWFYSRYIGVSKKKNHKILLRDGCIRLFVNGRKYFLINVNGEAKLTIKLNWKNELVRFGKKILKALRVQI